MAFRFSCQWLRLLGWEAAITMKRLVGAAVLCLLATVPVHARQQQDSKQQEAPKSSDRGNQTAEKPARKPATKPAEKPVNRSARPSKSRSTRTESVSRQQQKTEEKAHQKTEKTQQRQAKVQPKKQPAERQATNRSHEQNRNEGHMQTTANGSRGNETVRRIPEDRYRADFGRAHTFHVRHSNDRRFQFGGFWFQYTQAWPFDWAYGDNFYIIEVDGVDYLCDARYPGQRIEVMVVS
jgi:hypothetical protein